MSDSPRDQLKKLRLQAVKDGKLPSVEIQDFIAGFYERMEGRETTEDNVAWVRDQIAALPVPADTKETRAVAAGDDNDGQDKELSNALINGGTSRDPAKPDKPDWSFWILVPMVPVQDIVCLACDVEPRWFNRGPSSGPKLMEIVKRSREVRELLELGAEIPGVAYRTYPRAGVAGFDLRLFGRWARETRKWQLPDEFPMPVEKPKAATRSAVASVGPWPWGTYETKWLKHLAAAAEHFWTPYDPKFPATAPTSEDVTAWLIARGVPKRVAEIMAQILRDDALPPGPRVNK